MAYDFRKIGGDKLQEVRSRLVLNFPGFEQTDSISQLGRLRYGAEQTGKIWGFDVSQGDLHHPEGSHHTEAEFAARGENWETAVRLIQFRWNDIVHAYEKDSFPGGFLKNLKKYFAFFIDGTVRNYRKASWRYWGFTIFPILLFVIFIAVAVLVSNLFSGLIALPGSLHWLVTLVMGTGIFLALCKWPGDRLYLILTIADWGFARDMVHRSNPAIEARFAEFAETTAMEIMRSRHDEIVIVGHSFGSLWAVAALAQALEQSPDLLKGRRVHILGLGSSMLKIALARDAGFMRDYWKRIMEQPEVFWHEIQTKDDLIAFYKCDPFEQVDIKKPKAGYTITRIRFSKGMEKKRYKAMRKSFYRTHRQYILYYDKRVAYDYMLRLMGPLSVKTLALEDDAHKRIDKSGALLQTAREDE